MKNHPLKQYYKFKSSEAGCDEAGRGCLAGPVFAAAVILPPKFNNSILNDSKKLNEKTRNELREIIENEAICWAVSQVNNHEIDKINILNASILGMHKAISKLKQNPKYLIIDGNRFKPYKNIPYNCIVKGDGKFMSIAAASILAKTHRDEYMRQIGKEFPAYLWSRNKGYPTKKHREAIKFIGVTKYHRMSFRLLDEQLSLEFSENGKNEK